MPGEDALPDGVAKPLPPRTGDEIADGHLVDHEPGRLEQLAELVRSILAIVSRAVSERRHVVVDHLGPTFEKPVQA